MHIYKKMWLYYYLTTELFILMTLVRKRYQMDVLIKYRVQSFVVKKKKQSLEKWTILHVRLQMTQLIILSDWWIAWVINWPQPWKCCTKVRPTPREKPNQTKLYLFCEWRPGLHSAARRRRRKPKTSRKCPSSLFTYKDGWRATLLKPFLLLRWAKFTDICCAFPSNQGVESSRCLLRVFIEAACNIWLDRQKSDELTGSIVDGLWANLRFQTVAKGNTWHCKTWKTPPEMCLFKS